jgi:hypothetical protein
MRPISLIAPNVLGLVFRLVEIDVDAKPKAGERQAEMRAEVSH